MFEEATYITDRIVARIEAVPAIIVAYPLNFCPVPPSAVYTWGKPILPGASQQRPTSFG
jgi:hypothetical protein